MMTDFQCSAARTLSDVAGLASRGLAGPAWKHSIVMPGIGGRHVSDVASPARVDWITSGARCSLASAMVVASRSPGPPELDDRVGVGRQRRQARPDEEPGRRRREATNSTSATSPTPAASRDRRDLARPTAEPSSAPWSGDEATWRRPDGHRFLDLTFSFTGTGTSGPVGPSLRREVRGIRARFSGVGRTVGSGTFSGIATTSGVGLPLESVTDSRLGSRSRRPERPRRRRRSGPPRRSRPPPSGSVIEPGPVSCGTLGGGAASSHAARGGPRASASPELVPEVGDPHAEHEAEDERHQAELLRPRIGRPVGVGRRHDVDEADVGLLRGVARRSATRVSFSRITVWASTTIRLASVGRACSWPRCRGTGR